MLLASCLFFFASCRGDGPQVTVCIVDAANAELVCVDPKGQQSIIQLADAENYIALSPDDFKRLLDYARLRCLKP